MRNQEVFAYRTQILDALLLEFPSRAFFDHIYFLPFSYIQPGQGQNMVLPNSVKEEGKIVKNILLQ